MVPGVVIATLVMAVDAGVEGPAGVEGVLGELAVLVPAGRGLLGFRVNTPARKLSCAGLRSVGVL